MSDPRTFLSLDDVNHRYGSVPALTDVNLTVNEGEFVTLLGPSGCGKTTLLRIVAGFVPLTTGRISLDGQDIARVPAHRRPFNLVFQRPTLFPHLDVFGNVAFGLRMKRTPRQEILERVQGALALVRLEAFAHRRSDELSGGQMQRVCLARALVNRPRLLLLDEPLSALDRKIRLEMEAELRRLHRETGCAFLYVTHDQQEALAMSDRVVVLNEGRIEQVAPPAELYRSPSSAFAARFVDANVIPATVESNGEGAVSTVRIASQAFSIHQGQGTAAGPAWAVVRPEAIEVNAQVTTNGGSGLRGVVRDASFRGTVFVYEVEVDGLSNPIRAEIRSYQGDQPKVGADVWLSWRPEACVFIPIPEGGER
ncbi:MAG: ABC transporter ATP-binding protein [Actinomycetota bacterium]